MAEIELVIKIDEKVRAAITRMGLLRIPTEMQKEVDKAIQRGKPLEQEPCDEEKLMKLKADLDYAKFRCSLPIIQRMMGNEDE